MEEIQHIRLEGPEVQGFPRARNKHRVYVEVESAVDHVSVGHGNEHGVLHKKGDKVRLELYVDDAAKLAKRVRTDEHRRAWAAAEQYATSMTKQWLAEYYVGRGKVPETLPDSLRKRCNVHPAQFLEGFGYKKGIPPFERMSVIDPQDNGRTIDVFEWLALDADKQDPWLIDPPVNKENAAIIAADHTAQALARAMQSFMQSDSGKGRNRG